MNQIEQAAGQLAAAQQRLEEARARLEEAGTRLAALFQEDRELRADLERHKRVLNSTMDPQAALDAHRRVPEIEAIRQTVPRRKDVLDQEQRAAQHRIQEAERAIAAINEETSSIRLRIPQLMAESDKEMTKLEVEIAKLQLRLADIPQQRDAELAKLRSRYQEILGTELTAEAVNG